MEILARIIDDAPRSAAFNMAADLYMLSLCEETPAIAVRLYTWERPTITIGVSEKACETLGDASRGRENADWIRRPTGGRSVLHDGDLTYSCIFSAGLAGMGATLMETYLVVSGCLMRGLSLAGIDCSTHDSPPAPSGTGRKTKLPCFLSPNRHEIMAGGKKLVGSAQKRTAGAVLQHGSVPLTGAFRNLPDFLRLSAREREAQKALLARKCACAGELRPGIDESELRGCLIRGFSETLGRPSFRSSWTPEEVYAIESKARSSEFLAQWHDERPRRAD
jgi:lipoyl(octanoyl) transferase